MFAPQQPTPEMLARHFEHFATREFPSVSPLYERLSLAISTDQEMLALATHASSRPVPNLLLGAVHFLLLRGAEHSLAAFYPDINSAPITDADPYPAFRSFCNEHAEEIKHLLQTRRVQTNEVRRCAVLLPAFGIVAQRARSRPLTLVEIGASAGFNLLWDSYGYDYGTGRKYGNADSQIQLSCTLRGEKRPPIPECFPRIASRLGIDLQPVDVYDQDAVDWLRALIWPEHTARVELLHHAVEAVRRNPPVIHRGDALELLPEIVETVPEESILCLFHTFVINQFTREARERFAALMDMYGTRRDLYCISIAAISTEGPQLRLLAYENGVKTECLLANCSGHAQWLEWLEPA
jgi:hypothetical protein